MVWFWKPKKDRLSVDLAAVSGIVWLGEDLDAGVVVDRETAMEIGSVFACFNALTTDVGQVPFTVYAYTAEGRKKAYWTRPYKAFRYGPNDYQTTQDFVEQCMLHLLSAGDHYSRIGRVAGEFDQLYPIGDPLTVETALRAGRKRHTIDGASFDQADIFHVHGPSPDGITGRSFTDTHRQTLALAKALYRYGSRWFANGATPRGILILPEGTKAEDVAGVKDTFRAAYGGSNLHEVAAFGYGTDYKTFTVDPEKSQALGSRQQVNKEIAALWKVPAWRLYGETPPTLEARTAYYADTLGPWFVRIAGNVNKQLIGPDAGLYAEFNTAALLRADIAARYAAYAIGITNRFMTPNEVRERENMQRHADGDALINPNVMSAKDREALEAGKAGQGDADNG